MPGQALARPVQRWKLEEVEELARLIERYPVVAVFRLTGLRANLIHEMRRKLRGMAVIRVTKKTLFQKAAEKAGKPGLIRLIEDLKVPIGFIFSDISVFRLKLILDKNKIPMHAKAGERADMDVIIPEMNTGLPPGPILSDFGKLKIPTKIEGGQIWIAKDTLVAKKGDEISPALAALLARLDIKAVLKGITIDKAYEDGVILREEDLAIDIEGMKDELMSAQATALTLASEIGYLTPETIQLVLSKAYVHAKALALEAAIPVKGFVEDLLRRAEAAAKTLKEKLGV